MNEDERPLSGWTTKELRDEIERLESRVCVNNGDDSSSIIKELRDELDFRMQYHQSSVERFLESGDARSLNRSDHRRKKRVFWIECSHCGCVKDLRKAKSTHNEEVLVR